MEISRLGAAEEGRRNILLQTRNIFRFSGSKGIAVNFQRQLDVVSLFFCRAAYLKTRDANALQELWRARHSPSQLIAETAESFLIEIGQRLCATPV